MRGEYLNEQLRIMETSSIDVKLQNYNVSHDYEDQTSFY